MKSSQCLKVIEKSSFSNIASEASYVSFFSGQKLIKNAKKGPFWRVFENLKLAVKQSYQIGQFKSKIGGKCYLNFEIFLSEFPTLCKHILDST